VRGSVFRPDLGFVPLTVTASISASFNLDVDRGVLVVQMESDKLAAQAGLHNGDVIMTVDNTEIFNLGDFWHAILRPSDQPRIQLTVYGKTGQFSASFPRLSPSQNAR
jgi:S1-C subfamily serine protease